MSIDVVKSATLGLSLGRTLECEQSRRPEPVEKIAYGLSAVPVHDKQMACPLATLGDESGAAEDTKVMRHSLLREGKLIGDLTDSSWTLLDERQDRAAARVRQRA
jgi:hypothetical protein